MNNILLDLSCNWKRIEPIDIEYQLVYIEDRFTKISPTNFETTVTLAEHSVLPYGNYAYDYKNRSLYFASLTKNNNNSPSNPPYVSRMDQSFKGLGSYVYSISLESLEAEEMLEIEGYRFWDLVFKKSPDGEKLFWLMVPDVKDKERKQYFAFLDIPTRKLSNIPFPEVCESTAEDIHFEPDYVMYTSSKRGIELVNFEGEIVHNLHIQGPFFGACFNPTKKIVAFCVSTGIGIWDVDSDTIEMLIPHGCSPVWSPDGEYLWFYALRNPSQKSDSLTLPPDNSCLFLDESKGPNTLSPWVCVHHRTHVNFIDSAPAFYRLTVKTRKYEKIFAVNDHADVNFANAYLHQDVYQYGYDTYEALFSPCGRYIVCPVLKWIGENPTNIEPRNGIFCFLDMSNQLMWTSPLNRMYVDEKNVWVPKVPNDSRPTNDIPVS